MRSGFVLCAAAVLLSSGALSAAQESTDLFDLNETSIDRDSGRALASELVSLAQAEAAADPGFTTGYRKLIRIAYQLAPDESGVASAHERIRKGERPDPPGRRVAREDVMRFLVDLMSKAQSGQKRDDAVLARYLGAVGLEIDPANEKCLKSVEKFRRGLEGMWDRALAAYRPRTFADGTSCRINGLFIVASGTAEVGQVGRILLTYRSNAGPGLSARLLRERADMMNVSADEAIRYWERVRKTGGAQGGLVEISFEDKFSKKDGPSAGAAYAVLLRAFSDPFAIDSAAAMTGDVSVEGRILQVGGVYPKIRGAILGGCKRVGIPASNESELTDALIVSGSSAVSTLAEIEVFGLETVDDAVAMTRQERDPAATRASEDFTALRAAVERKQKGGADADAIRRHAQAILASCPNHLSAKLIDLWNDRKLPARLTLGASLSESSDVLVGYLLTIRRGDKPTFADLMSQTSTTGIAATIDKLRALMPKVHLDAQKPVEKLEQACLSFQRYIYLRGDVEKKEKKVQELEKAIKELKSKIDRARAERRSDDEINALVKRHNDKVQDRLDAVDAYTKESDARKVFFVKALEHYNEYVVQVRALTQDPRVLEKLQHGK